MTDCLQPSAACTVAVHLLDSAQGHPLQTWRFKDQETITIGRSDGNDVVLSDPHVSRTHATIVCENGAWSIVSIGRHGTLVNDRMISEATLKHHSVFRLGSEGPTLRFDAELSEIRRSETLDNISSDIFEMLAVDDLRKEQEVSEIVGNPLFHELKEQSRRHKSSKESNSDAP